MTLQNTMNNVRNNNLPNVTNIKQMKDYNIVEFINEGLSSLHSIFVIRKEQAIIRIDRERKSFVLSNDDPDVVLNSMHKTSFKLLKDNFSNPSPSKTPEFNSLKAMDGSSDTTGRYMEEYPNKPSNEVLQIISVEDVKQTKYVLNEKNVFLINQNTLYFPNCKNGEFIYVTYKPKPIRYTTNDLTKELDLPDTLLECLYSFIALKVSSGIEGLKEFHNIALSNYTNNVQEAMLQGAVVQESLEGISTQTKGFI